MFRKEHGAGRVRPFRYRRPMPVRHERFAIPHPDGHALAARLVLPADGAPRACALFAHCFTCSKDLHAVRRVAEGLARRGIGVLSFDFTGLGQSEGDFADTSFSTSVEDLVTAARYLGEHHAMPQLLIGHSLGGAAVLVAASLLPEVRAVATIGAPCSPDHVVHLFTDHAADIARDGEAEVSIGGRPFRIKRQFLDDLESHDTMAARIAALDRPLLVFHSPTDQTVGIEQARAIYDAARHPKSFVSLDGADHLLSRAPDAAFVAGVVAAWAERYLDLGEIEPRTDAPAVPASPPPGVPTPRDPAPPTPSGAYADATVTASIGDQGFRTEMSARGHAFAADEPAAVGGTETAPTPYDYLGAALAACTAMTLRMYADRKTDLALDGVTVRVTHDRVHADDCAACADAPKRIDRLTRRVALAGDLTDAQRARLLEIADRCPVHRTLESRVRIESHLAA